MLKRDFHICEWQWPGDLAQLLIAASYSYHVRSNLNKICSDEIFTYASGNGQAILHNCLLLQAIVTMFKVI